MSTEELFKKAGEYIESEVQVSLKDYEFITKLNDATAQSFKDYQQVAQKIAKNVERINKNQEAKTRLNGLIESIDRIDAKVTALESLAFKIDSYSKRLETAFKQLELSKQGIVKK